MTDKVDVVRELGLESSDEEDNNNNDNNDARAAGGEEEGGQQQQQQEEEEEQPKKKRKLIKGEVTEEEEQDEPGFIVEDEPGRQHPWSHPDDDSDDEERGEAEEAEEVDDATAEREEAAARREANMPKDEVSVAIQRASRPSRRRQPKKTTDFTEEVKAFLHEMGTAATEDESANRLGKPALHKLHMLATVTEYIKKKDTQEMLLENELLKIMRQWLSPLPDNSLPNVKLRTELFSLLLVLPCDTDQLRKSKIGEIVMIYYKHKEETPRNKRLCKLVIEKWSRPLFGLSSGYRKLRDSLDEKRANLPTKQIESLANRQSEQKSVNFDALLDGEPEDTEQQNDSELRFHARIPFQPTYEYTIPPPARFNANKDERRVASSRRKMFEKHLANLSKKTRK